jgi:hypothetical protein
MTWLRWGLSVLGGNRWMIAALAAAAGVLVLVGVVRAVGAIREKRSGVRSGGL